MAESEPSFDVIAVLDASTTLISAARAELLRAVETYRAMGPELVKTALERVRGLSEPASPARTEAIRSLSEELPRFDGFWPPLAFDAALLFMRLNSELTSMAVEMMTIRFPTADDVEGKSPFEIMHAYAGAIPEALKRNQALIASAAAAERDVAEAVQQVAGLLTARLNLLVAFIHHIDLATHRTDAAPEWINRSLGEDVGNQAAVTVAGEFLKEALKHIPLVGIAVSMADVALAVREKREALRRQRELWEKVADAYCQPNAYEDMKNLLIKIGEDDKNIEDVLQLTRRLQAAFSGAAKSAADGAG